jgi:hypothetical protein
MARATNVRRTSDRELDFAIRLANGDFTPESLRNIQTKLLKFLDWSPGLQGAQLAKEATLETIQTLVTGTGKILRELAREEAATVDPKKRRLPHPHVPEMDEGEPIEDEKTPRLLVSFDGKSHSLFFGPKGIATFQLEVTNSGELNVVAYGALLKAFSARLAFLLAKVDLSHFRECAHCHRFFLADHRKQFYHNKRCMSSARSERYRDRHSEREKKRQRDKYEKKRKATLGPNIRIARRLGKQM